MQSAKTTVAAPYAPSPPARERFIGFVSDAVNCALLHEALKQVFPNGAELHQVRFGEALRLLGEMRTPEIVLIDLTGENQPLDAMHDLADVVEPGTNILAIGENREMSFYRSVTRGMGVLEYLQKPLTREGVERHFLPRLRSEQEGATRTRGGRVISVAGARGGSGCSTIAANLAWLIGGQMHRHTVLLDADLYLGTAALALNVQPTTGLKTALEAPERLDHLLIERAAQPAAERLHVLAAAEPLTSTVEYAEGGAAKLCQALRPRYNFIIADLGTRPTRFSHELAQQAQQKVFVLDPSVVAVRNFEKILRMLEAGQPFSDLTVVLNHAGRPGGLARPYMEQLLGLRFDAVIPHLPRDLAKAAHYGTPAAARKGVFRDAILAIAAAVGASALAEPAGAKASKAASAARAGRGSLWRPVKV
jgi:pilus assembly protein CpaE